MNAALHQWFTPRWVCEAIIERHFPGLDMGDVVLEPSCGPGRFLQALPDEAGAIGVEIDPVLAEQARAETGRHIITGDFLEVHVPGPVTAVVGNPPFEAKAIAGFLDKIHGLLVEGGSCGLLLPAYVLQTSSKVAAMNRRWSISTELMPRNIFPGLSLPLVFTMFRKDPARRLVGFFLYRETADVVGMPKDVRAALDQPGRGSVWRHAVRAAFVRIGEATATLEALYAAIERPTQNQFWRQQVRKVLLTSPEFRRAGAGLWSINPSGGKVSLQT